MTPEEAYEEALRRIREAEETGALELDLSGSKWETDAWQSTGLEALTRLPPELVRLASLQSLDLSRCKQLSGDLSPLAGLTALQSLNISYCELSDLSPLAALTSLRSLDLQQCWQLRGDLAPLAGLISLQSLNLFGCGLSGDLFPLAGLSSLQSLNLGRTQLSGDLSPLAGLNSIQTLDLSLCLGFRRFAPLESLLPTLKKLYLYDCKFEDLPPEICGEYRK